MHRAQPGYAHQNEPTLSGLSSSQQDWGPQDGYANEPSFYPQEPTQPQEYQAQDYNAAEYGAAQGGNDLGFGQAAGGELDQGYVDEDQEYEAEQPSRFRRPAMMAAVLTSAIVLGGGMTYGYKAIFGGPSGGGVPPVVKSATAPSKVKPEEGGGKQFAHTDSKIMGRLGEGGVAEGAGEANAAAASDTDAGGTRKVSTLVVGRDGSIQAPAPAADVPATSSPVVVPGLTVVDGLGTSRPQPEVVARAEPPPPAKVVITAPPAPKKPVTIAKVSPPPEPTGSIEPEPEVAAPAKPKKTAKTAAAPAAAAATAPSAPVSDAASTSVATTGSGFVAVLASVPRSTSSRMDALKRFADMQQKYADVLSGKTPDVAEANLGTKGKLSSPRGRSAGIARAGEHRLHAVEVAGLQRLLGHLVLRHSR